MNGFLHNRATPLRNTKYNNVEGNSDATLQVPVMKLREIIISSSALLLTALASISPVSASSAFESHYGIGKSFLVNQNFDMAVKEFTAALVASPNNADALVERGTAFNGLKKYDLALKDFGAAIKAQPNSYLAFNNRGVTYLRLGDTEKAIQNFDRAIAIDSKQDFAYLNRAGATLGIGSGTSAASSEKISAWLKSVNWHSDYSGHAAILGALGYRQAKQPALAKSLIADALNKTDRLKWPYPALQYFAGKLNSKELLDEAERSDYDNTQAHCFLALDLRLKGETKQSLTHLDWILKHGIQNSVEYWIAKGLMKPQTVVKPSQTSAPQAIETRPAATSVKTANSGKPSKNSPSVKSSK